MTSLLVAQITDTHIGVSYEDSNGRLIENHVRLEQVVYRINSLRPMPDFAIVTGDISDKGGTESYYITKSILDRLKVPYHLTCGNHDLFSNLKQVFKHDWISPEFANAVIDNGHSKIIILDSSVIGQDNGTICAYRLNWLRTELAKAAAHENIYIFMHHYPIDVQHESHGCEKITNTHEFAKVLTKNVKGIYCGHYHLGCCGSLDGTIPCWISPSVAPQFELSAETNDIILLNTQPAFSLHKFYNDGDCAPISRIVMCGGEIFKL